MTICTLTTNTGAIGGEGKPIGQACSCCTTWNTTSLDSDGASATCGTGMAFDCRYCFCLGNGKCAAALACAAKACAAREYPESWYCRMYSDRRTDENDNKRKRQRNLLRQPLHPSFQSISSPPIQQPQFESLQPYIRGISHGRMHAGIGSATFLV